MIALLLPLITRLGVPARFQRLAAYAALAVAALALCGAVAGIYTHWLHGREKAAVVVDRAESNAAAVSTARQADQNAAAAASTTSSEIEHGNDAARAAADSSADPLGDGLRSLRQHSKG